MYISRISRVIEAPPRAVFSALADAGNLVEMIDEVALIEFTTDKRSGLGSRFVETRVPDGFAGLMGKLFWPGGVKFAIECTGFVENERVVYSASSMGICFDSVFTVSAMNGPDRAKLEMRTEMRPQGLPGKLILPLVRFASARQLTRDIDGIKAYCDRSGVAAGLKTGHVTCMTGPRQPRFSLVHTPREVPCDDNG